MKSSKKHTKKEKITISVKKSGGDRKADNKRKNNMKIFLFFERNTLSI